MEFMNNVSMSKNLWRMLHAIREAGGQPLIVGGAARDAVLRTLSPQEFKELDSKDVDVLVRLMKRHELVSVLSPFGKVSIVGESFESVLVVSEGDEFDFVLPRTEIKTGVGNGGFEVFVHPSLPIDKDMARRDFTINAFAIDPFTGEVFDPFNGIKDLCDRVLRPVSERVDEDPLRMMRAMNFVSRFGLTWTQDVIDAGIRLQNEFDALPQERLRKEWIKWAEKSIQPSLGLELLRQMGWLQFFPELEALDGCPQDVLWHPEGDAFQHTGDVCDAMMWQCRRDGVTGDVRIRRMFGALCHDLGKATHTWLQSKISNDEDLRFHWTDVDFDVEQFQKDHWDEEWRWRSHGHDLSGAEPTRSFMNRLFKGERQKSSSSLIESVVDMVVTHMQHGNDVTPKMVKNLSAKVNILDMEAVVNADTNGRPFNPETWVANPKMQEVVEMAMQLSVEVAPPEKIVLGRHLISEFGWVGGPKFKPVLDRAFEAQLDGEFDTLEGGLEFLKAEGLV